MDKIVLNQEELDQVEYHKAMSSKTRYKLMKLIKESRGIYNLLQIKKIMNCSYQGLLNNISMLERVGLIITNQNVNEISKPIYPMVKKERPTPK